MEDIHTSRIPSHIPPCGHLIHKTCYAALFRGGHYACPICQVSMVNMESVHIVITVILIVGLSYYFS